MLSKTMRYFFPASLGDETYEDAEGTWFSTPEEAKAHAEIVAAELALRAAGCMSSMSKVRE